MREKYCVFISKEAVENSLKSAIDYLEALTSTDLETVRRLMRDIDELEKIKEEIEEKASA